MEWADVSNNSQCSEFHCKPFYKHWNSPVIIVCYVFEFQGYHKLQAYIATQDPMPSTTEDFWRMVWEQQVTTIIKLTGDMEGDGYRYWPDSGVANHSELQVIYHSDDDFPDYILRDFKIVNTTVRARCNMVANHEELLQS